MKLAACCGVALLLAAGSTNAEEKMTMLVRPTIGLHPSDVIVYTFVEKNPENRSVQVIADAPEIYASSEAQLDGDQAPRLNQFTFRDMPAGEYDVRAILIGQNGKQRAATSSHIIIR